MSNLIKHESDEEVVLSDPPVSKRARSNSAGEPASKRLRQIAVTDSNGQRQGPGSSSSMAQQHATPGVIPDTQQDDDSDVEIIGETQAPDSDVLLVDNLSPRQLASQRARIAKGKGRLERLAPKPDPEQEAAEEERLINSLMFKTIEELDEMVATAGSSRNQEHMIHIVNKVKHLQQQQRQAFQLHEQAAAAADAQHCSQENDDTVILETQLMEDADDGMLLDGLEEQQQHHQQQQEQQQQMLPQPVQPQQRCPAANRRSAQPRQQQQQRRQRPQPPQQQQRRERQRPQPPPLRQQQQQQESLPGAGHNTADAASSEQRRLRKLRKQLTELQRSMVADQERLSDPRQGAGLASYIEEWQHLDKDAKRPREASKATEVLANLAELGTKMVTSGLARSYGRRPVDLVAALKRRYRASQLDSSSSSGMDLAAVAAAATAAGCWRDAPGLQTMVGPLAAQAKLRAVGQRRPKDPVAAQVKPVENPEARSAETQETDHWMQTMREVMSANGHQLVPFVQLVIDHESFSQTVENIFALSFLVKDMWCSLEADPQRGLLVRHLTKQEREARIQQHKDAEAGGSSSRAPAGGRLQPHQFMFTVDRALWEDMKQFVPEGEGLMPHREPVLHTAAAAAAGQQRAAAAQARR